MLYHLAYQVSIFTTVTFLRKDLLLVRHPCMHVLLTGTQTDWLSDSESLSAGEFARAARRDSKFAGMGGGSAIVQDFMRRRLSVDG